MVIERYEGNIASSVAMLEGKIIIIAKKRHFAICVIIGKPSLTSINGYTSKCKAIQNGIVIL